MNIRSFKRHKRMTQEQLADFLQVSFRKLQYWLAQDPTLVSYEIEKTDNGYKVSSVRVKTVHEVVTDA